MMKRPVLFCLLFLLPALFPPVCAHVSAAALPATADTKVQRVFGSAPPMTLMIYAMNPASLVAANMPPRTGGNDADPRFFSQAYLHLPVMGGWQGNRRPNLEEILLLHPDLIVLWDTSLLNERAGADLKRIHQKVLRLNIDGLARYPSAFRKLGNAMGDPQRGETLARYIEGELHQLQDFVATIPQDKRVRVYYAEDRTGLRSDCDRSFHADVLTEAGGDNVLKCVQSSVLGLQSINFEQLLNLHPDVIVTLDAGFLDTVKSDQKWQLLQAVRDHRIVVVPQTPVNWLDRPPSFMRVLGAHWLAASLYPGQYPYDLTRKTQDFFDLFYHVHFDAPTLQKIFPFLKKSS